MTDLISPTVDDPMEDVLASKPLETSAPTLRNADDEHEPREIHQLVHDRLQLDGVARMNLTFSTTWVEPEARQLSDSSLDKNIVDKDGHPQAAEIKTRCLHKLTDLLHSPEAKVTPLGYERHDASIKATSVSAEPDNTVTIDTHHLSETTS
ncbi:hypothetical protein AX769_21490 (plasmid) [Frondihabitans sp. PAMC 28766]|uniref:hypothetical protein n=1 Tax=Frondihabitans sp. PAMC 28766 TaxID=1795630 RepID=UPI00078BB205|nr:hypothetical protein [Frondihabitans sp. PAMC 28766]AMM22699.1 hypothetical protein AX769_21490 [Frondihabitans sp. PAMC 28766]